MKTTFQKIKDCHPCTSGWKKLTTYYKPESLDEEITIEEIVKSNDIRDAIWAMRSVDDKKDVMLFCSDVAESVLNIFEQHNKEDDRPRKCIEGVRLFVKGEISEDELKDLRAAAADAAAAYAAAADAATYAAAAAAYAAAYAAAAADAAATYAATYAAADATAYAAADAATAAYAATYAAARQNKWKEIEEFIKKY